MSKLAPDAQLHAQKMLNDTESTRKEICLFFRSAGLVVYPGSITRHRAHSAPDAIYEAPNVPKSRSPMELQSAQAFIETESARLKSLSPDLTIQERAEALSATNVVIKAYWELHGEPDDFYEDKMAMDIGWFYTPEYQELLRLRRRFTVLQV